MTKVIYNGEIEKKKKREEDRIRQGDFVYCEANGGAYSFWGIYSAALKTIIVLDGASTECVKGDYLYLGDTYVYWTITKRIPCDKAKITIEEFA
jgi:hypothetical protein